MNENEKSILRYSIACLIIFAVILIITRPAGSIILSSYAASGAKKAVSTAFDTLAKESSTFFKNDINNPTLVAYRLDESSLDIYSLLLNGEILVTKFTKKQWGTWNILGWYIAKDGMIPTNDPYVLAGDDTDWEYVYKVSESAYKEMCFSGGNHGREILRDIEFINGDDNSELKLEIGQKQTLSSIKIIEKTTLTTDENFSSPYADVIRNYTIRHATIDLTVDYKFTACVFMGTSYVCMFPIEKKFGNFIQFNDAKLVYTTPEVGKTSSTYAFDNFIGEKETLSAQIWGSMDQRYRFNVWIGNSEMVDNFSNKLKVFYWDLNKATNKLYFSKYDTDKRRKIEVGTTWHHEQGWSLNLLP